ncbi:MAG: SDR family NAD(P)-dependent oxidoreductase [Acidobacteriota bacterium]
MPAPTVHGFAEKVALVVNGSDGIGRAAALQLALQGCYVIVSYEKTSENQVNALEELKSLGTLASAFQFSDPKSLINEINNLFGRLDLLINCVSAGADAQIQIETITIEALEIMKFRPKPSIVNVLSENQPVYFYQQLPNNFRQNCVVAKAKKSPLEHELFSLNNFDDVARVILFFLSSEAKALNNQVLFTD